MAGQRENDEVDAEMQDAFKRIQHLRPSHRTVSMWKDLNDCLTAINQIEFLCNPAPEKPVDIFLNDLKAVQVLLGDARRSIGMLALAIAEDA